MECVIREQVDYLNIPALLKAQRAQVCAKIIEMTNSKVVYKGLSIFKEGGKFSSPYDIPGVKESGWRYNILWRTKRLKVAILLITWLLLPVKMFQSSSNGNYDPTRRKRKLKGRIVEGQ